MQILGIFAVLILLALMFAFFARSPGREAGFLAAEWKQAMEHLENEDASQAERALKQCLVKHPEHASAMLRLCEIFREQHREGELQELLARLLEMPSSCLDPPGESFIREEYAEICFFRGQLAEAMLHYLLILGRGEENHPVVLCRLVWLYASQGLFSKAAHIYQRIPPRSRDIPTRFTVALCHAGMKNWEEARSILLDILADRREEPIHCYVLGKVLIELGDREGAANWLQQFISRTDESTPMTQDTIGILMRHFYTRTRYHSQQECQTWNGFFERFLKDQGLNRDQKTELVWQKAVFGWLTYYSSQPSRAQGSFDTLYELQEDYKEANRLADWLARSDENAMEKMRSYYDSWRLSHANVFENPRRLEPSEFFGAEAIDVESIEATVDDSFLSGVRDLILGRSRIGLKEFSMLGLKQTEVHLKRFFSGRGFREFQRLRDRSELYVAFEMKGTKKEAVYGRFYPAMGRVGEVELTQLYGEMTTKRYDTCLVLVLGTYTSEASRFASKHGISLISGAEFEESYLSQATNA